MRRRTDRSSSQLEAARRHSEEHFDAARSGHAELHLHGLNIQQRRERVLDHVDRLDLPKGSAALELGCGVGLLCVDLLDRGYRVVGLDVAQGTIDMALKRCTEAGHTSGVELRIGNAEALEFEDEAFDLVTAVGLVESIPWDRWALQEIHRVLKPDGHLIVTAPNRLRLSALVRPVDWLRRELRALRKRPGGNPAGPEGSHAPSKQRSERRLYRPGKFDRMLGRLGYEVIASDSHGFGPFPLVRRSHRWTIRVNDILQRGADSGWVPGLHRLGSNYNVLCRKLDESQIGCSRDPDRSTRAFRREYRKAFSRLNDWIGKHPRYASQEIRCFDVALHAAAPVLVLSPHADDEIIGCGGSLLKLRESGAAITVVMLTDGAETRALQGLPGEARRSVRLHEAREVADGLGATLDAWNEPDSKLACSPECVERLANLLEQQRPGLIFVPFINDLHHDHVAANRILAAALKQASVELDGIFVLAYEVWAFVPVDLLCDIDAEFGRKLQLLRKYRTGMKVRDYVGFCRSLNSYHAFTRANRRGYAEGFFSLPASEYVALVDGD
jgi:LmbE family N-acetylglucosaminyl deacetylase/2-polyprenyl-3-methyl-5-hydroxy-6-metoxy-1,4-benzoquinol methylase